MEYAILIITLAILIVMVILLFQLRSLKKNGGQGTYLKESHRQLQQAISASRQETLQLVILAKAFPNIRTLKILQVLPN